jgi:hypothetical protein
LINHAAEGQRSPGSDQPGGTGFERTIPVGILDVRRMSERQQSASRAAAARSNALAEPELPNENGAPAVPPARASGTAEASRKRAAVGERVGTADGPGTPRASAWVFPANDCNWMPGAAGTTTENRAPASRTPVRTMRAACPEATAGGDAWSRWILPGAVSGETVERAGSERTRLCRLPVTDRPARVMADRGGKAACGP